MGRKLIDLGLLLVIISVVFGIAETIYFGSKFLPETIGELYCDFLSATILGAGIALIFTGINIYLRK